MKNALLLSAAAGAFLMTAAVPAYADWQNLGQVDVGYRHDRDVVSANFGGAVEGLRIVPNGTDVTCGYIRATFGNGETRQIFSGFMSEGQPKYIDLPGNGRWIKQLAFGCHSFSRHGAGLTIEANIGRYQDQWQRDSNWASHWAHMLGGAVAGQDDQQSRPGYDEKQWQKISDAEFHGMQTQSIDLSHWEGKRLTALGLLPNLADADCPSIMAHFENGDTQHLFVNGGKPLEMGQWYRIDLPGGTRNLTGVDMTCRPIHSHALRIQVYKSRE